MTGRKRKFNEMKESSTLSLSSLYQFISKSPILPTFPDRIRDSHPKVQELLKAIQMGDSNAPVFSHPNCQIYLLHLINTPAISEQEAMTVYAYLLALMQYTDKQPLKKEDLDLKVKHDIGIDRLSHNGKLTAEGETYIAMVIARFKEINYDINKDALINCILSLPPTEQWLLRIHNIEEMNPIKKIDSNDPRYFSAESMKTVLFFNVPLFTLTNIDQIQNKNAIRSANSSMWIPSSSIIEHLIKQVSPNPLQLIAMFGRLGLDKLYEMHAKDKHPGALYSRVVKSNLINADNYRAGPFITWLHDISHVFFGSLIKKDDREMLFSVIIPFLKKARDEAAVHNEEYMIKRLSWIIDSLADLDLTPIDDFINRENRFAAYLQYVMELSKTLFIDPFIGTRNINFYILLNRLFNESRVSAKEKNALQYVIPRIKENIPNYANSEAALFLLSDNDLHGKDEMYFTIAKLQTRRVNWRKIQELLTVYSDNDMLSRMLVYDYESDFITLVVKYDMRFYPRYLPLTDEKRQVLTEIVKENLELEQKMRKSPLMLNAIFHPEKEAEILKEKVIEQKNDIYYN